MLGDINLDRLINSVADLLYAISRLCSAQDCVLEQLQSGGVSIMFFILISLLLKSFSSLFISIVA